MLDRFINLIKAMFNQGVSKLETPEILAEQAQMEMESSLKKVKEGVTASLANEKMLAQNIQKNKEEIATWEKRAAVAVQNSNDDVAKQCLQKKNELNQSTQSMMTQLAEQEKTSAALKQRYNELQEKARDFEHKKKELVARVQAGEAVAKANELLSSSSGSSMDKWEQKIRDKENRASALNELHGEGPAADAFKEMDKNIQLDDQLAALKAQMNSGPKLIVSDGPKQAEVVDDDTTEVEEIDKKGKS